MRCFINAGLPESRAYYCGYLTEEEALSDCRQKALSVDESLKLKTETDARALRARIGFKWNNA